MTIDFNVVSFVLAIISIILALFSLWQSKSYRDESTQINNKTKENLDEIKTHIIAITQYAIPELKAYGETLRKYLFQAQRERASEEVMDGKAPIISPTLEKNISHDIIEEINFLKKNTGRSLSIDLFERLKHKYDFSTILSEILIMGKNSKLKWAEVPNPPEAHSQITVVEEEQSQ
jgi:hypothetical protein